LGKAQVTIITLTVIDNACPRSESNRHWGPF
jgi:hypothetical protein